MAPLCAASTAACVTLVSPNQSASPLDVHVRFGASTASVSVIAREVQLEGNSAATTSERAQTREFIRESLRLFGPVTSGYLRRPAAKCAAAGRLSRRRMLRLGSFFKFLIRQTVCFRGAQSSV